MGITFKSLSRFAEVSECSRYELRGAYSAKGYFWNGFEASTGRLIAASADKEFVKLRCEMDSLHSKEAA